jgi:hypothetical protein
MKKTCDVCRTPVSPATLDKSAKGGDLGIRVQGMPVGKCAKGHHSPVHPDFMLWLIHELKEKEGALAAGTESGVLFLKKYTCGCGAPLSGKSERRQAFPFDLAYEGYAGFKAEVEAPVYKCTGCGKEQLRSHAALRALTSGAIVALNDAAGFSHSG